MKCCPYLCVTPRRVDVASVAAVSVAGVFSVAGRLAQHGVKGVLVNKVAASAVGRGDVIRGLGHGRTPALIGAVRILIAC